MWPQYLLCFPTHLPSPSTPVLLGIDLGISLLFNLTHLLRTLCVWMCVVCCVSLCVCRLYVCMCTMHACVEAGGWRQVSSSLLPILLFDPVQLSEPGAHWFTGTGWLWSSWGPPVGPPQCWGYKSLLQCLYFYEGSEQVSKIRFLRLHDISPGSPKTVSKGFVYYFPTFGGNSAPLLRFPAEFLVCSAFRRHYLWLTSHEEISDVNKCTWKI